MDKNILAIETTTHKCSVALQVVGSQCLVRSHIASRDHAQKILPMIDELLKEAGVTLPDLDALAFGRGPGSFIGTRVSAGIAQGLAFGMSIPLIPISTLKIMAQGCRRKYGAENVALATDAKMSEIYWARYSCRSQERWHLIDSEIAIAPDVLPQYLEPDNLVWFCAGTGWEKYTQTLSRIPLSITSSEIIYPDAKDLISLARYELEEKSAVPIEMAGPVYLRETALWKKLPGRNN